MTSMHKAPEKTLNLEEIIPHYNFILVDNCILYSKSNLSDELYMVKEPGKLHKFTAQLQELEKEIQTLRGYITKYNTLYLTPEVKEEMMPLVSHLRRVASYHQSKLPLPQRAWKNNKSRLQFQPNNKRYNKFLERQRDKEFDFSEYRNEVQQTLDLICRVADDIVTLSETFPIYQSSNTVPRLPTLKASMTDAGLLGALIDYAQKQENKKNIAAILTADGDIISLFHTHLQSLPPVEQMDLSSRLAVHFRNNVNKEYTWLGFHPSYRVRETVGCV